MNNSLSHGLPRIAAVGVGLALAVTCAWSQALYRSVDAQGRVTFSDRALVESSMVLRTAGRSNGATSNAMAPASAAVSASAGNSLPPALQLIVSRYPVTLLTSKDCVRCGEGRSLLTARGVPFAETVIATAGEMEQLQNQTGKLTLPVLTVGTLPVKDFTAAEWNGFLDAAGYPKASALPTGYKNPPPVPWLAPRVARAEPPPAAEPQSSPPSMDASDAASRLVPLPPSTNPLGLRF